MASQSHTNKGTSESPEIVAERSVKRRRTESSDDDSSESTQDQFTSLKQKCIEIQKKVEDVAKKQGTHPSKVLLVVVWILFWEVLNDVWMFAKTWYGVAIDYVMQRIGLRSVPNCSRDTCDCAPTRKRENVAVAVSQSAEKRMKRMRHRLNPLMIPQVVWNLSSYVRSSVADFILSPSDKFETFRKNLVCDRCATVSEDKPRSEKSTNTEEMEENSGEPIDLSVDASCGINSNEDNSAPEVEEGDKGQIIEDQIDAEKIK